VFSGGNPGVSKVGAARAALVGAEDRVAPAPQDVKHDVLQSHGSMDEFRRDVRDLSDADFREEYNVYQAEYMKRRRARRKQ
jgi:hypothetical protein